MTSYQRGERVRTPDGTGSVAYVRMASPDYAQVEAVSVILDGDHGPGYVGTIYPAAHVERLPADPTPAPVALSCDWVRGCTDPITHIDSKGYIYCRLHGRNRDRCRKLTRAELQSLEQGTPIRY